MRRCCQVFSSIAGWYSSPTSRPQWLRSTISALRLQSQSGLPSGCCHARATPSDLEKCLVAKLVYGVSALATLAKNHTASFWPRCRRHLEYVYHIFRGLTEDLPSWGLKPSHFVSPPPLLPSSYVGLPSSCSLAGGVTSDVWKCSASGLAVCGELNLEHSTSKVYCVLHALMVLWLRQWVPRQGWEYQCTGLVGYVPVKDSDCCGFQCYAPITKWERYWRAFIVHLCIIFLLSRVILPVAELQKWRNSVVLYRRMHSDWLADLVCSTSLCLFGTSRQVAHRKTLFRWIFSMLVL